MHSEQIRIKGLVQGVGFRPTVWQVAKQLGITGEVRNDGSGVVIIAQSSPDLIDRLLTDLSNNQPPLARIDKIERETIQTNIDFDAFSIEQSILNEVHTGIVADSATCAACLDDINDKDNRRSGYAFTNCTDCGPRLSIVADIPYDRSKTSMAGFIQCPDCQQEYENPADRRFHAQPNACPTCGPQLSLCDTTGRLIEGDPLDETASLLKQGYIIAIKGIGGFQLACDATNGEAVASLRSRKHRPDKALALMAASASQVKQYCVVSNDEKLLLESSSAPIVLLDKVDCRVISNLVAPRQNSLGFMLPNSPLHHLLMQQMDSPIVLTSGNRSEEPQCIENEAAFARLKSIADYFLANNRDILNRIDDSVARVIDGHTHILRRARGYAPLSLKLPQDMKAVGNILACGGELKNTFAIVKDYGVTLSQHIGNLENHSTYEDYLHNLQLYKKLFQFDPDYIAVDKHPEYLSSKYGRAIAEEFDIPCLEIQHHHAHIAACMTDNGWSADDGPVIGIALDGLGYGDDNTIWGGEFMIADYLGYDRVAHFKPVPMPGGTQSILQPWRNTYAQLSCYFDWPSLADQYAGLELIRNLRNKPLATLDKMISGGLNTPLTSSCGRLFDAVAAALGICPGNISYEGQAAIELENHVNPNTLNQCPLYRFELVNGEINAGPMWMELLEDIGNNVDASTIAARFHLGLANVIAATAGQISRQSGIKTIALCGGVFQNKTLFRLCLQALQQYGLSVLFHRQIPTNDGGLAVGQATIANAILTNNRGSCV